MAFTSGLVSVLTPAYNRIKYIDEAVQSVLDQSYSNIEYIVIDDGSSDGTFERLQEYERDGNLTLLTHPGRVNKGQAAALNLGLQRAKGEFICVLDSDDWFDSSKLSGQVSYLDENMDVGIVYGTTSVVDESGNERYQLPSVTPSKRQSADDLLLDCFIVSPGCALMRSELVAQVGGFDETLRAAQDHDLALKIAEKSAIGYVDDICFYYRKHDDSISKNGQERRWFNGYKILESAVSRYPYSASTVRSRRAVIDYRMAQVRKSQCKYFSAFICLIKSSLGDPRRALKVLMGSEKAS